MTIELEYNLVLSSWTFSALSVIIIAGIITTAVKRYQYVRRINRVPGAPGGITILGNAIDMISVSNDDFFTAIMSYMVTLRPLGPILRFWGGPIPGFFLFTAHAFEVVLSSNKLIDKSREYTFLHPWLGTGLLTSTGSKWQGRRKLLTPTFHFKILEDFLQVFNEHAATLIQQLEKAIQVENEFNIYPFITLCTLDIICDSAMGCNIKAQTDSESDYVKAVYSMSRIVQKRQSLPWLQPDLLFQMSSYGKEQKKCLQILHNFTDKVIQERKAEHKKRKLLGNSKLNQELVNSNDDFISKKKRLALLDLLIEASQDGALLSDTDIREEVDTFMFEGHDTTTAAINWSLLCIGSNPQIQEQVAEELDRVFSSTDKCVTISDLNELKYLECCIKEALRLYPSVPMMGRDLSEDTIIHGYDIPAKTSVILATYMLHRDPEHFPDPELYRPERFFPENSIGRHPFAYVPFSAGSRNCIGQRFALMEEKTILASILRRYRVEAVTKRDELILMGELILRPRDGIRLRFNPRK